MRSRNRGMGYGRIAMQLYQEFGIEISRFAVGRILRQYGYKFPPGDGPSWLTFFGQVKDSLWSVDLFRCESITLRSHWVMVVIDQFTRRIIGFSVHAGDCDGIAYCQMLNRIISGKSLPRYLSSDNDPLFLFHRWKPDKWDQKAFRKALFIKFEKDFIIRRLVIGVFINTEEGENPFFTLGYKLEHNNESFINNLLEALHTQFRKYTRFEFIDLNEDSNVSELLLKQGLILINR